VVLWRDLWAKAIATPMDATVGCLWAEGIADEILFFWRGQRLLAFTRSNWIDDCGRQCRHPPAEPSRGVAWPAHCRSSPLLRALGVAYRAAFNGCQRAIDLRSGIVGSWSAALSC
jgi:hypothetical protein